MPRHDSMLPTNTSINRFMQHTALLLLAAVTGACSSMSVSREIVVPPELAALHGRQQIYIDTFDGHRGNRARSAVVDALTAVNYHQVQVRPASGAIYIRGAVSNDQIGDQTTSSEWDECVARDKKGKCTKKEKKTYYTRKQSCALSVRLEVVDSASGSVLFSSSANGDDSSNDTYARGESAPSDLRESLCGSALADAVSEVVKKLVATVDSFDLSFHEVADRGETERAVQFVRDGRLEDAQRILVDLPASPSLTRDDRGWAKYNLALVYFAQERFSECAENLDQLEAPAASSSNTRELRELCNRFR